MADHLCGYYKCGHKEFGSKVDALLYSKIVNKKVEWIFHDDVYQAFDWSTEPAGSMDDYYNLRARELREKYDYIIISYSGGADSENVLQSFVRQGLLVDEIITNHLTKANRSIAVADVNNTHSWNFASEHELQTVPRLKWISDNCPKTKITLLDVSDVIIDSVTDDQSWFLGKNDHLAPGQLFRNNYWYFNKLRQEFDKNRSVGIITGGDKPRTFIENDILYLYFLDSVANITTINDFNSNNDNIKTELFFHGATTAPMIAKQVHVIKRWLEANPDKQEYWRNITPEKVRLYHERFLRPLLYPTTWDNSWYQVDKSVSWWHTEFDTWFRTNPEFARQKELWDKGIMWLADKLGNLVETKNGVPDTFVKFRKVYQIGTMKPNLG